MKKLVCYGDSNTFGLNPVGGARFDENTRWTSILQKNLSGIYEVINEGMCNRIGFVDNPAGFLFSAQKHFPEMISKAGNIDLLILAIGTNDLMFMYDINTEVIEFGLENLIKYAKGKTENIIIIPPVILSEKVLEGYFKSQFDRTSIIKSESVGKIFLKIADMYRCIYFDINKFTSPSDADGLHYDENSHKLIAEKLTDLIKKEYL